MFHIWIQIYSKRPTFSPFFKRDPLTSGKVVFAICYPLSFFFGSLLVIHFKTWNGGACAKGSVGILWSLYNLLEFDSPKARSHWTIISGNSLSEEAELTAIAWLFLSPRKIHMLSS